MVSAPLREFCCAGCGVFVSKRSYRDLRFCSQSCYAKASKPGRVTRVNVACGSCGNSFKVQLHAKKAVNYCSVACHDAYQRRTKVARSCSVCGSAFLLSPSNAKQTAGRYCSIKCRTACTTWKANAAIAGNLKQMTSKGPNRLELAGRAILAGLGLSYAEQVLIGGKFSVDVQLVGCPVVIQWDGDYWHGYRAPGDARPLDARQAKRVAFDRSQDAYMRSIGLVVLRFWEHEVRDDPEKVACVIASAVMS